MFGLVAPETRKNGSRVVPLEVTEETSEEVAEVLVVVEEVAEVFEEGFTV